MTYSLASGQPPHLTHMALSALCAALCGSIYAAASSEIGTTFSGNGRPNNRRALPTKYFRHHVGFRCFNRLASTKAKTMIIDADKSGLDSDIGTAYREWPPVVATNFRRVVETKPYTGRVAVN